MSPYTPVTYSYGFPETTLEDLKAMETVANRMQKAIDETLKIALDKLLGPPVTDFSLPQEIKLDRVFGEPEIFPVFAYGSNLTIKPNQIPYSRHRSKRIWKKLRKRYGRQDMPFGILVNSVTA